MSAYQFETVWPTPSDVVREDVVDFWLSESALPYGRAIERAHQLLVVCRDASGAIAAVSTAVAIHVERLGVGMYYFRAFVGRAHRVRGLRSSQLAKELLLESYRVLNDRFQQQGDKDGLGLYFEIENRSAQRIRNELVWSDNGANVVFTGFLPNGNHARVWYFEGARLPR